MIDLKDNFANNWKNSNALQFLNSYTSKWYEARRLKNNNLGVKITFKLLKNVSSAELTFLPKSINLFPDLSPAAVIDILGWALIVFPFAITFIFSVGISVISSNFSIKWIISFFTSQKCFRNFEKKNSKSWSKSSEIAQKSIPVQMYTLRGLGVKNWIFQTKIFRNVSEIWSTWKNIFVKWSKSKS